ncbi:MAG: glycosyltransferase family 9 protein [Pirellulaceae bacterium]
MFGSMFRRRSAFDLAEIDAGNICIIKPSAFGDIVQSLPLLPVLRSRFPQARITWVVKCELADVLVDHPFLDELLSIDVRGGWRCWARLLRNVRRRHFDLVFDLQGLFRTALVTLASGAPLRVGLETAREGAPWSTNCVIPETTKAVPAHARYWRVAECLGLGSMSRDTVVGISDRERRWAQRILGERGGLVVAMHPGAKWITKQWPAENFAALAIRVWRKYGASFVLLGTDSERPLGRRIEQQLQHEDPACPIQNLMGRTRLKPLAALLGQVHVLMSNDSGPMHLAAGLGTPVLGIFTCTSPLRSGPPGDHHELVATKVRCAARYKKACPFHDTRHMACFDELSVDRAWRAFQKLVAKNGLAPRAA